MCATTISCGIVWKTFEWRGEGSTNKKDSSLQQKIQDYMWLYLLGVEQKKGHISLVGNNEEGVKKFQLVQTSPSILQIVGIYSSPIQKGKQTSALEVAVPFMQIEEGKKTTQMCWNGILPGIYSKKKQLRGQVNCYNRTKWRHFDATLRNAAFYDAHKGRWWRHTEFLNVGQTQNTSAQVLCSSFTLRRKKRKTHNLCPTDAIL